MTISPPAALHGAPMLITCRTFLIIAFALIVAGFCFPASAMQQETPPAEKKPPAQKRVSKLQEAMIKEAGEARAEIVRKLKAGQYVEFMHQHSPIDDYLRNLREGQAGRVEMRQVLGFANLATQLESLADAVVAVDTTGRVATFTKKEDFSAPPAPKGPYSESAPVPAGYGKDLMAAIKTARDDLDAERYTAFTDRMFPPSTINMMKADGRWEALQTSLSPDSPLVMKMLDDLALLKDLQPKIKDGTAEIELPNHVTFRNRREGEEVELGTRKIRFSLIDGSWRFYDATAKVSTELDAALAREPAGESATALLVLEKIGSDWRLRQMPGIRPQTRPEAPQLYDSLK